MTDREYRRLQANFARQSRLGLPYSPTRVGVWPRLVGAWRELLRPDPAMGLDKHTHEALLLVLASWVVLPIAGLVAIACGL